VSKEREAVLWGVLAAVARRDTEGLAVLLAGMDRDQLEWSLHGLAVATMNLVRRQVARDGYADPDEALVRHVQEQILLGRQGDDGGH
jgi:hypothetical protein